MKRFVLMTLAAAAILFAACDSLGVNPELTVTTNTGNDENDFVDNQTWDGEPITIVWNGSNATIGALPDGVTASSENGYVALTSTIENVEYQLSGQGTGQLKVYSTYKYKLTLSDLSLTCATGPAINNQSSKSLYLVLEGESTLEDASSYTTSTEDQKAALFSEGQVIVSGDGSLSVVGNYKHAFASDDYIRVVSGNLTLVSNVSDGMHANDGIIINGGTISITAANDGIQCDTSSIVVTDGAVDIVYAGDKGMLAYGNIEISGGTITIRSTDKGVKTTSDIIVSGGVVSVNASVSSSSSSQHVVAGPGGGGFGGGGFGGGGFGGGGFGGGGFGGNSNSGAEGIEAKGTITISAGEVYAYADDDAINSGGDFNITGGYVFGYSTGNDGLDANGNLYIKGGLVYAIGSSSPELAIDANTEGGKKLYVTGGTIVAVGGLESGSTLSQTCYSSQSWSKNTWYALYSGNELVFAFLTPASGGTPLVVSTASSSALKSGVSVADGTTVFNGMGSLNGTVTGGTSVSLSTYSSSSRGFGW